MSRWLVAGAGGMLGRDVIAELHAAGIEVSAADRSVLDITDPDAAREAVAGHDVVVNAAAWTAVDDAETHEAQAFSVNAIGAGLLARACAEHGARMVHISSDYVFDGHDRTPYPVNAPLRPRSAYGRTKAAGEWAVRASLPGNHWILRIAWLYGEHGPNFVSTMARLAANRPFVEVVTDEVGQPTWTVDVARQMVALVAADAPSGIYHATSAGQVSWFDFAQAIFTGLGLDPQRVHPTTAAAFGRPAPRPSWSVLDHQQWAAVGLAPIRSWQEALAEALPHVVPPASKA